MAKLTLEGMFKESIQIGLKNAVAVIVNVILWGLTFWIPYLNVGTTIGLVTLVAKMGKDEGLSMTEIFNPEYRKYMGEFFLVVSFVMGGVFMGFCFFIIPGYVIAIAWSLAALLVLDKNMDPIAAIKKSNELTYGSKWMIFLGSLLFYAVLFIAMGILVSIVSLISEILGSLVGLACFVLIMPLMMGLQAYIYRELTK